MSAKRPLLVQGLGDGKNARTRLAAPPDQELDGPQMDRNSDNNTEYRIPLAFPKSFSLAGISCVHT